MKENEDILRLSTLIERDRVKKEILPQIFYDDLNNTLSDYFEYNHLANVIITLKKGKYDVNIHIEANRIKQVNISPENK